eukprot:CAMPEP_0172534640 /NCGR_PEP_ID=MMETSP1067-20121228/6927_1 /TAXON_ID=265564 ORGANISM="Thalassiosira punctigera, Strain Tpunct2005C2" /NCGR_SAMPLE_ID=MMETSP1067 /ASSEMBLY_ACC=CAM_ASM_000444 /LENGTH=132 /DNA_ID=CAMNT_0013319455 /DNA_START=64 /DNA_END=462 /DNA_ORIENTATION=-
MKTSTIAFLVLAAVLAVIAPSPVAAYESMLNDEPESTAGGTLRGGARRLGGWWNDVEYWRSIYYRCCNLDQDSGSQSKDNPNWRREEAVAENYPGNCKCPVRGSENGWGTSYFERWQSSCQEGGKIYTKAGI